MNILGALAIGGAAYGLILLTGNVPQWIALGIGYYAVFSWATTLRRRDPPAFALIWGSRTSDLSEAWLRIQEGVSIGGITLSPMGILGFLLVFGVGYMLTRFVQGAFRNSILPKTSMDAGGQSAVISIIGYIGIGLAAMLAIKSSELRTLRDARSLLGFALAGQCSGYRCCFHVSPVWFFLGECPSCLDVRQGTCCIAAKT